MPEPQIHIHTISLLDAIVAAKKDAALAAEQAAVAEDAAVKKRQIMFAANAKCAELRQLLDDSIEMAARTVALPRLTVSKR